MNLSGQRFILFKRNVVDGRHGRTLLGAVSILGFLIAWQIIGSTNSVMADLVSSPSEVLRQFAIVYYSGELPENLRVTLNELAMGFLPATTFGIVLGAVFALSRRLRYLLEPIFVTMYVSPYIAFIPVLTVWFGVGSASKSIIVFIASIAPIIVNTTIGVTQVSPQWISALRVFGASRRQVVMKAILPGALPSIMTGVRLGIGRAIVAVVAAEMYVSTKGIGSLIQVYSLSGRTPLILVFVGLVSFFGLLCVSIARSVEEWLAPWRKAS